MVPTVARGLVTVGILLVASGLFHVLVWALLGGPWEGPVAWRKPILFGVSTGVTCLSLGWILGKLPPWRGDRALATLVAGALAVEVALITLQTWRGVGSHFNTSTPLDTLIHDTMTALILVAAVYIAYLTARALGPINASADVALAIRLGLLLLWVGCVLGFVITTLGQQQLALGQPPTIWPPNGILKFPHGMPLHAIQVVPALAWLTHRAGWAERARWWAVLSAGVGYGLLSAAAFAQTLAGRSRLELTPINALVVIGGALAIVLPGLLALLWPASLGRQDRVE